MRTQVGVSHCGLVIALVVMAGATGRLTAYAQSTTEFVPVTDAMLQDPAPEDWLMWRRTLDGWGYSPLDQITRENVGDLRMVWTRALGRGSQQGTPLAYNGVLYMPTPGMSSRQSMRPPATSCGSIDGRCRRTFPTAVS
jgi:alcohol dehydrogenase (cytochrome c)